MCHKPIAEVAKLKKKKKKKKGSVIGGSLILNRAVQVEYKELGKQNKQTSKQKNNTPKQAKNPTTTSHGFFFLASFKVS